VTDHDVFTAFLFEENTANGGSLFVCRMFHFKKKVKGIARERIIERKYRRYYFSDPFTGGDALSLPEIAFKRSIL